MGRRKEIMKIAKRYIYPPRPKQGAIPHTELSSHRGKGWKAQLKYNGNRILISVNNGEVEFYNRHNALHKYTPSQEMIDEIKNLLATLGLDGAEWNYLDGELLHTKHKLFKDTVVIWDILVRDSEWLLNSTYEERYNWLAERIGDEPYMLQVNDKQFSIGIKISDHIFLPVFIEDSESLWDLVTEANEAAGWKEGEPLLEGVVLKRANAKLTPGFTENSGDPWQIRCRVSTGRHRY